jgi:hypothetical protein
MDALNVARWALVSGLLGHAVACGVDGPAAKPADGGSANEPVTSSNGSGGAGNAPVDPSTSSSGAGGSDEAEPSCDNLPEGLDPSGLPLCPAELCGGGARCIPLVILEAQNASPEQLAQLADCEPESKCVPDLFIETAGFFTPATCSSLVGAEGRCLSTCIPEVKAQNGAVGLPQDICLANEVCVPCYNPQDGSSTGACEQSCDTGPVEPPTLLPACCGGNGTCVPEAAVPSEQLSNLGDYGCDAAAGAQFVCAPNVFVDDPSFSPTYCDDLPFLLTLLLPGWAQEGRCLPDCLPALDDAAVDLEEGACGPGFLCAPCYQPGGLFSGPEPTGACDY